MLKHRTLSASCFKIGLPIDFAVCLQVLRGNKRHSTLPGFCSIAKPAENVFLLILKKKKQDSEKHCTKFTEMLKGQILWDQLSSNSYISLIWPSLLGARFPVVTAHDQSLCCLVLGPTIKPQACTRSSNLFLLPCFKHRWYRPKHPPIHLPPWLLTPALCYCCAHEWRWRRNSLCSGRELGTRVRGEVSK